MSLFPRSFVLFAVLAFGWVVAVSAQNPIPPPPRASAVHAAPGSPAPTAPDSAATASSSSSAATSSNPASPAANTTAASGDYILASADAVEMSVFHQPDLTTQARIAGDGSVQFPLIGEIKIGGLTLRDARELIRRRYNADYLVEPQVYLNVISYAQRKFTILGQVNTPGTYLMPGGEHLGLMEAIGMAGGFTRIADKNSVSVKRTNHGADETFKVNTKKLTTQQGKAFEMQPGDVVTVGETWL